jgi:ATP-dependent DNA helicase DinG
MNLTLQVRAAFAVGGVLSRAADHFVVRDGQTDMALAVAHAIEHAQALVVEASTGVGKTFSYLVPALLSGERVLVSTATKALQDQLFGRDLPRLVQALGVPVSTALLKGRASYVCLHRLSIARQDGSVTDKGALRSIAKIEQWAQTTRSGDLAELSGLDERSPLIPLVTSTRENCLGSNCPQFKSCHVNLARREAMAADVVVINHHLFFADLAVRESGMAELLPTVRVVIFDEAHQLNEIGVQFLGQNLTTGQLLDFCRDMLGAGLQLARGLADWHKLSGSCEQAARELRLCAGQCYPGTKLRWTGAAPENVETRAWADALVAVASSLHEACASLDTVSEIAPDFARLKERANVLVESAIQFSGACGAEHVRWVDVGAQLRLIETPLTIAAAVKGKLLAASKESAKTWIFTSATLGEDDKLSWFTQPCGLEDAQTLRVGSPFDYSRQAALYIPEDFPKPADPAHLARVAESTALWARKLGGRTMVLTTTLKAMRSIGDMLTSDFERSSDIEVLVQGMMPKRLLIERFRRGRSDGGSGCVLVASASFWEGIDVPGDSLQLVVIDKLPFPPPSDPMAEARSKALEARGQNPFNDYFLPETAIALKQGAGRLIRRETDEGVLVVCDGRLTSMGYGKRLIRALPAMKRLSSNTEMLDQLTKVGTRADSLF